MSKAFKDPDMAAAGLGLGLGTTAICVSLVFGGAAALTGHQDRLETACQQSTASLRDITCMAATGGQLVQKIYDRVVPIAK